MEKTIEEWLSELPDGYRERAMENRKKFPYKGNTTATSLDDAILNGFWWGETPEKHNFWQQVYDYFYAPTLPPLPE